MEIRDVLDRHAKNKNEEKNCIYLFVWYTRSSFSHRHTHAFTRAQIHLKQTNQQREEESARQRIWTRCHCDKWSTLSFMLELQNEWKRWLACMQTHKHTLAFIMPIKLLIWRRLICNRIAFEICSHRHQQQQYQVDTVTHHSNDNVQLNFLLDGKSQVHKLHGITACIQRYVDVLKLYSLAFCSCVCESVSERVFMLVHALCRYMYCIYVRMVWGWF